MHQLVAEIACLYFCASSRGTLSWKRLECQDALREVVGNAFSSNGGFGNPTNGDIALDATPHNPGNCFHDNTDPKGLTSDPPLIQSGPYNPCGQPNAGESGALTAEALCNTQLVFACPSGVPAFDYPHAGNVVLHMPPPQPTMPDPCAGVPANPWCPRPRRR